MAIRIPKPESSFERVPEGNRVAVCDRAIDLGTQESTFNNETKRQRKVLIGFVVPDDELGPMSIAKRYTLSGHEKSALRKDLEAWRSKRFTDAEIGEFELSNIIGKPALVNVVHSERNGSTYADIAGIAAVPKGTPTPELTNDTVCLSLDPEEFDPDVYDSLSDRLKETIAKSPELQRLMVSESASDDCGEAAF